MKAARASFAFSLSVLVVSVSFCLAPPWAHASRAVRNQALPGTASKYKAIWEPINYPADISLNSVYFATERRGWIAGTGNGSRGGVILHTDDGGEHWNAQLGDPNSSDAGYEHLYFLDARHGWAVQNASKLLRTSDGKSWEEAGSFPKFHPFQGYKFTTPQSGYEIAGYPGAGSIFSTRDGGRTWREDFKCAIQLQVQGLTKHVGCSFMDLAFPSPQVGYAVGGGYNGGFAIIAKTEDAGATWRMIFATTDLETVRSVFFTDERHGVIRLGDNKIFATEDGGQSWRGMPASAKGPLKFADPSVGWSCNDRTCSVTIDGGHHWIAQDLRLPEYARDFSVARRDRVFLVGNHGMIYRYRIVPRKYTAKRIAGAPLVPAYGSELTTQLGSMQTEAQALETKVSGATDNGFVQDTGFTQEVSTLESDSGAFTQDAPAFAGRYRNLNLLFVGLNMLQDLNGRAAGIRDAVQALKSAQDLKSASAALQDLLAKIDDANSSISSGFENLAAAGAPATAGNVVSNMMAPSPAGGSDNNNGNDSGNGSGNGNGNGNGAGNPDVGQAVNAAKSVLKSFIKF